ncbi:MAG: DUF6879 family protein [Pseudonocardiaceae bacterium]
MRDNHIRLRVQTCGNGDECPALDRREAGWIEVTGELVDRPGLPPGERTVRVPDTLLPEIAALDVNLGAFIAQHHRTDLLRVQTLTHYEVASDDEDYHRYLDGAVAPTATGKQEWLDRLRTDTIAGRLRRNVHIVHTPLTPYLGYQFEWCYLPNTAAGQDIRVLDAAEVPAVAALLRVGDLAIVEGQRVAQLRYGPNGEYQGAVATGADATVGYVALAQVAWELATPFTAWWAAHPQYHRDNSAA